jgi:hypothetical protein
MQDDNRARLKQWLESTGARLHPLGFPQRELWENSPVPVDSPANHICSLVEIRGALSEKQAVAVLQRVVDRQEVLRTSFLPGKEGPLQLVRSTAAANVQYREHSAPGLRPEALTDLALQSGFQPFDLVQGPLYRAEVLRRTENDHLLVFSIHHAIADGWSLGVFVQELAAAYVRERSGLRDATPPVQQSYTGWAAAERLLWQPAELMRRVPYWKGRLAGVRQIGSPDGALERAAQPLSRTVSSIPREVAGAAPVLARECGATLFSTLLAAFQLALSRWMGHDDLVVGTPTANRNTASVRQTMGYFSGVVPLRGQVDRTRTVAGHVRGVHENAVEGFENAMPFAEIAAALGEPRAPGLHTIFDVRFALLNHPLPDIVLNGISTRLRVRSSGTARFDLGCEITEIENAMEVVWLFKPSMFPPAAIGELDRLFLAVLARACASPEIRIAAMGV